jgi:glycosyl transferase family 25
VIKDHFDRIFVLNMKRSLGRRAIFLKQASTFGLSNIEFIQAIDGRTLDMNRMRSQGILRKDEHLQRDLTPGEVGCYLSHVKAWQTLLEYKLKDVLICEDDILWRIDANAIVDKFMAEVPGDWDIIHFHSHVQVGSGNLNDPGRKQLSKYVWQGFNEGRSLLCYALTARGVEFLLDIAFPIQSTADGRTNWLTGWWKRCKGYHGYVCWPFPCEGGKMPSEIDAIILRPEK